MVPIGCPETSVNNYQPTLRSIPQERRPHGILISYAHHTMTTQLQ